MGMSAPAHPGPPLTSAQVDKIMAARQFIFAEVEIAPGLWLCHDETWELEVRQPGLFLEIQLTDHQLDRLREALEDKRARRLETEEEFGPLFGR